MKAVSRSSKSASDSDVHSCITCRLLFPNREQQILHYKSSFHYFNAKRRLANLSPISREVFQKKLKEQFSQAEEKEESFYKCDICSKTFRSINQLEQHHNSKKHKFLASKKSRNVDKMGHSNKKAYHRRSKNKEMEDINDMDDTTFLANRKKLCGEFKLNECLFCSELSGSVNQNIDHMYSMHGFTILFSDNVKDKKELLQYIGDKILLNFDCLYCGKMFRSIQGVQHHMVSTDHCKMRNDSEYSHLYNPLDPCCEGDILQNGELTLSNSRVLGHRDYKVYYKQIKRPGVDICIYQDVSPKNSFKKQNFEAKPIPLPVRNDVVTFRFKKLI